jgi:hypothetical protein
MYDITWYKGAGIEGQIVSSADTLMVNAGDGNDTLTVRLQYTAYNGDSFDLRDTAVVVWNRADTVLISDTTCQNSGWHYMYPDGSPITEAGIYEFRTVNIYGCDSIVRLNLSYYPAVDTAYINEEICYGQTYNQNGFNQSTSGTYFRTIQNANGCDSTIVLNLSVSDYRTYIPTDFTVIHFDNGHKIYWTDNNSISYDIYRNNDFLINVSSASYQDNDLVAGNTYCYKIRAKNANDCYSNFTPQECITATISAINELALHNISIFPNPAKDIVTIAGAAGKDVIIYDNIGRQIFEQKIKTDNENITLNVLSKGIYLVKITENGTEIGTVKLEKR